MKPTRPFILTAFLSFLFRPPQVTKALASQDIFAGRGVVERLRQTRDGDSFGPLQES